MMEGRGNGVRIIMKETEKLSAKTPHYQVLDHTEVMLTLPMATGPQPPANINITVRSRQGETLEGAEVLCLFPDGTGTPPITDHQGQATTHLPITVMAAASGYAASLQSHVPQQQQDLIVILEPLPTGGSVIFKGGSGSLPGLKGQLEPIRDPYDQTYLYASNIAINKGKLQPVYFALGMEELDLVDADGQQRFLRIIAIIGHYSLLQYDSCHREA